MDAKLPRRRGYHRTLVRKLVEANELRNVLFVSTNYDILLDNALTEEPERGMDLDYAVEFRNFDPSFQGDNHWRRPDLNNFVQLFKSHGSLNWLFCPTCNELEITPKEKGVVTRLISDFAKKECFRCKSVFSPLLNSTSFFVVRDQEVSGSVAAPRAPTAADLSPIGPSSGCHHCGSFQPKPLLKSNPPAQNAYGKIVSETIPEKQSLYL